jgi:hypothetical protein
VLGRSSAKRATHVRPQNRKIGAQLPCNPQRNGALCKRVDRPWRPRPPAVLW